MERNGVGLGRRLERDLSWLSSSCWPMKSQQTWVRVFHLQNSPLETLYLHSPALAFSSSAMHGHIFSQCSLSESPVLEGSTHLNILMNKGIMVNKLPWCPGRRAVLTWWEIETFEKWKPSLEWKCHHSSKSFYKAKWIWLLNISEACWGHLFTNNVCQGPTKCGFLLNAHGWAISTSTRAEPRCSHKCCRVN